MLEIIRAFPEDVAYITDVSECIFSIDPGTAPVGYDSYEWYLRASTTGYLFKIMFNNSMVGGFTIFKTGRFNFQLERIFILPDFQNIGIGKKAVQYVIKRFPEAKIWYSDVRPEWQKYSRFLNNCGFFESGFSAGGGRRFIKILH